MSATENEKLIYQPIKVSPVGLLYKPEPDRLANFRCRPAFMWALACVLCLFALPIVSAFFEWISGGGALLLIIALLSRSRLGTTVFADWHDTTSTGMWQRPLNRRH